MQNNKFSAFDIAEIEILHDALRHYEQAAIFLNSQDTPRISALATKAYAVLGDYRDDLREKGREWQANSNYSNTDH